MPSKEIPQLTDGGVAADGDQVHAVRGGNSRRVTLGDAAGLNMLDGSTEAVFQTLRWLSGRDITLQDLDDIYTPGFYTGYQLGNAPEGDTGYWYIVVQRHAFSSDSFIQWAQKMYPGSDGGQELWIRTIENGTIRAWGKIYPAEAGSVGDGTITMAKLADLQGPSVIGRAANTLGVPAAITAAANDRLLRRTSDALDFGQLTAGMVPNSLITAAMMADLAGVSLLGRSANSSGVMAAITAAANDRVLGRASDALSFMQITAGMIPNSLLTYAMLASAAIASASEIRNGTASKLVDAAGILSALDFVTLTDAATISIDFDTFINGYVALGGDRTLGNPSNENLGRGGVIIALASGAQRTLNISSDWDADDNITWPITISSGKYAIISYVPHATTRTFITGVAKSLF